MTNARLVSLTKSGPAMKLVSLTKETAVAAFSLYDAKTHLSSLVERAARGEEIVIAKSGVPRVRLSAMPAQQRSRSPANAMDITFIADDFDTPDKSIEALFAGEG